MAEGQLPETGDAAVRGYIDLFALGFVLAGVDMLWRNEGIIHSVESWSIAGVLAWISYHWRWLKPKLNASLISTVTAVANDARAWIILLWMILGWLLFSPYVNNTLPPLFLVIDFLWKWVFPPAVAVTLLSTYYLAKRGGMSRPDGRRRLFAMALLIVSSAGLLVALGLLAAPPSKPAVENAATEALLPIPDLTPKVSELEGRLAAVNQELEATRRQLESARQTPASPSPKRQLGPLTTLQIVESLAATAMSSPAAPAPPKSNPNELRWALVITAPKENDDIANVIAKLISARLDAFRLDTPDRSANLDAPAFPEPGDAGITLHGTNVLNQRLVSVLAPCFIVRTTSRTVEGLREWYSNRASADQNIVWIEIGKGSPWREPFRCAD